MKERTIIVRCYDYVNTRMGSASTMRYSNGNCYPVCALPHGMNFFSVQTSGKEGGWFYSPYCKSFEGLRLTHLASPWMKDYGSVLFWADRGVGVEGSYWSGFDNGSAVLDPAYISVSPHLDRYRMELAPSGAGACLRVSFSEPCARGRVLVKTDNMTYSFNDSLGELYISTFDVNPSTGAKLKEHIVLYFNKKVSCEPCEGSLAIAFEGCSIEIGLATSYISLEQARLSFRREIEGKSLEEVKAEAERIWEDRLSKISVEDPDEEKKRTFYSCLYRFNLWPRKFYEIDPSGKPVHINTATGEPAPGYLYTDNGFWDTYRTVYPLLSLLDRDLYAEMAEGFYNYYVDTGWLPKWVCPYNNNCMPGMLIEATLSDAIVKDIVKGELAERIFLAMLKDGECDSGIPGVGRVELSLYRRYGYLPYWVKESVNETLDNAFGDYAIAKAAEKLGKRDIAQRYFDYSRNYEKLFDPKTGFIRGKDENGNFRDEDFDPCSWGRDYTEGSAWQNAFGVYHDIKGLDRLYGGKLMEKIDALMTAPPDYRVGSYGKVIHEMTEMVMTGYGQCAISNQPSFHIPYIYSELGRPDKTSYHISNLTKLFTSSPEGYPGDEDNGSMSAWYVLSAMGLYQMSPSRADFDTSVPVFEKMAVKLSGGNVLYIMKEEFDPDNMRGVVDYREIMKGGSLWETVKKQ